MAGKRKRGPKDGQGPVTNASKKAKKGAKAQTIDATAKPSLDKKPFVEMPTGDDRRREANLYEILGSEDEKERIEAADCIVSSLLDGEGVPETVLQRHLDRRLFRGLASGRNASRIGFSLVITEILGQLFGEKDLSTSKYSGLSFRKVLGLLVENTQAAGNIPGQEERDYYFGQLFGIECFVRSQTLLREPLRWQSVLDLLLRLGNKKIWLRSQCGWVLVQALGQMSEAEAEDTLTKISAAGMAKTPEGVAAWIVTLNRYPNLKVQPWKNPLANKSLGDLAAVLKESFKDSSKDGNDRSQNGGKQASWSAQLHFVWDLILARFVSNDSAQGEENFDQFWNRVVDDGLFSKNATDGQKFKGFMVFQKMLEGLVDFPTMLNSLFSKNFMTCLVNQAAKEDRYLHRAAVKALKAIEVVVASQPEALPPVLSNLLGKNGSYGFDQRTSSKTVDKLLQNIDEQNAKGVLAVIRSPIKTLGQKEATEAQATLRFYADYLAKILNAFASAPSKVDGTDTAGGSFGPVLQELAGLAYSNPKNVPEEALTEQFREMCRSRLESSLARLARSSNDFAVFCEAVASIDSNAKAMTSEIKTAMDEALARMGRLLKRKLKNPVEKNVAQGLAMLHAISIFQLYNEDPDAMDVLSDLAQFYDRLKAGNLETKDSGSSELLVEILLSMVARPSSLMRQVSQQVFEAFTSQISAEGLELLTGPLASGESTKGQMELFNTEDDAMDLDGAEEDEEEEEDDGSETSGDKDVIDVEDASDFEIDSDLEFVDLNGESIEEEDKDENDAEEETGEDNDDDDDGESDEEDDEDGDEFNTKQELEDLDDALGKILRSHRLDKDNEAESSDDDADMSDSEMLALDEKLAEAIKHRVNTKPADSKKQKKDAKQSVVNFKHRILDLLDIYVKHEAANPLSFSVLVPLLHLMRTTSTKPLANRACEIILTYQRGLKKARAGNKDGLDADAASDTASTLEPREMLALLAEVHDEAGKDNSHAYAKAASAASLIVASTMFGADRDSVKQVAEVYAKTQSDWVLGEAKLQNSFFADWNNWCQNHASQAPRS